MNLRPCRLRGFVRVAWLLLITIVAFGAALARYGAVRFHYGALGFAGLLLASVIAFGLLALAFCMLMGGIDVYIHKRRMRERDQKGVAVESK
jgi:hypothetical protein